MMKPIAIAAEAAAKAARHRKFLWCRLWNDFIDLPLWRVVSAELNMPLYQVQAFVIRLDSFANAAIPRGYVGDFSAAEFGAALGMPADEAARIYALLERDDVAWILQDHVQTFYGRNPDKEDKTSAERQQRKRERDRGMKEIGRQFGAGLITEDERRAREAALHGLPPTLSTNQTRHGVTHRDSRDVTPRAEQRIEASTGENFGDRGQAEEWLGKEGKRIVIERMTDNATRAQTRIERWRQDLEDDVVGLVAIIREAEKTNYEGSRFHNLVIDQIKRHVNRAKGPSLPLPMVGLGAKRSGAA